jgi:hypothetical protein
VPRLQKAIIVSKARATKDKPASIRMAPEVLEAPGDAGEDVDADRPSEEAELTWLELGDPVAVLPGFSGAAPVAEAEVPLVDPVGPPLELVSVAVGDPAVSALELLGELDEGSDREFGLPAEEVVDGDGPEGSASWASPVHPSVANPLPSGQNHLPTLF